MRGYRQFCPVAKAAEVFAERWMPLVLRELLWGIKRFNDSHRGVPLMSRSYADFFRSARPRVARSRRAGQGYLLTIGKLGRPV